MWSSVKETRLASSNTAAEATGALRGRSLVMTRIWKAGDLVQATKRAVLERIPLDGAEVWVERRRSGCRSL